MLTRRVVVRAALAACVTAGLATVANAQTCPSAVGPDVVVGNVGGNDAESGTDGVADYAPVGGIDAFAVGTFSCNIGNIWLNWMANSTQHPVIPQNMYRMKTVNGATRFEQIGMSWCKHGFFALSETFCCPSCQSTDGTHLGIGCSDPYTPGRNGTQVTTTGGLGPRFQINPHTGAFIWPYMFRGVSTGIGNNTITRRLQVALTDLDPGLNAGAHYFFETQYVTPDDAAYGNQDNNVSYREGLVSGPAGGTDFSASMTGFITQRSKAAITAWKKSDMTVTETAFDTPETDAGAPAHDTTGRGYLSAKATDLGGGVWHYEYALYNMNSDRAFDAFTVAVSASLNVTNIGFHDVSYHDGDGYNSNTTTPVTFDGTDWPGVRSGAQVAWNMVPATPIENSNALRWATLYNFRFDCNSPPTNGNVVVSLFKALAGQPDDVTVATVIPAPRPCFGDIVPNGGVDVNDLLSVITHWGPCPKPCPPACPQDIVANCVVDVDDLLAVITHWGACP